MTDEQQTQLAEELFDGPLPDTTPVAPAAEPQESDIQFAKNNNMSANPITDEDLEGPLFYGTMKNEKGADRTNARKGRVIKGNLYEIKKNDEGTYDFINAETGEPSSLNIPAAEVKRWSRGDRGYFYKTNDRNDPKLERWRNIDDEDVYTNRLTDENPLRPLEFKEEPNEQPATTAPEPVAEGTAELRPQEKEFIERADRNIETANQQRTRVTDEGAAEADATPSTYEVESAVAKTYTILDDPDQRKTVIQASEENPLYVSKNQKVVTPVNQAAFYTLKLANHFALTDAQKSDTFLQLSPLMNDAALKRLNDLVFDPINGALFDYDVDFEQVGPVEGELTPDMDVAEFARANKDSLKIAIVATPTDLGRESSNAFDSTMAALLNRKDPITGEKSKFAIGPAQQKATPFTISGGDMKAGTFKKISFKQVVNGGRLANTRESEALIGTTLEGRDPRTVKAGLIRGVREVLGRGYQLGYMDNNNNLIPLDLDEVFAANYRTATTLPPFILGHVVFEQGGVKYTIGDLLRIDDPRPVSKERTAQDQEQIERKTDEQLANDAVKHLFTVNGGMTDAEYDYAFTDPITGELNKEFYDIRQRNKERILNARQTVEFQRADGSIGTRVTKPLLDQERKRQLDIVRDRDLTKDRFQEIEYAGDEGSLEARSLSEAVRMGAFEADNIENVRRQVIELRERGEIIYQRDIDINADPAVVERALKAIQFWPYRSRSNREATIRDPDMAALAKRLGLNLTDPILKKDDPAPRRKPDVRFRSISVSQMDRIGTRSRLVVEEGRRMGERQDQSVTPSRTPTPVDADRLSGREREEFVSRPKLPPKKAGRTKLIGNVFNQGRLSQGVQSIARFADQTLGLTTPVEVVALSTLRDNLENYVGRGRRYGWAEKQLRARVAKMTAEEGNVGGVEYLPGKGAIVVVNDTIDAASFAQNDVAMALTVGHEIGHVFFSEQIATIEANPQLEKRMWDAFRTDRSKPDAPAQYRNDKHGFEEWFSDQVSKFLFDQAAKPQNLVESKFKAAAGRLKRFFAKINKMFGGRFT